MTNVKAGLVYSIMYHRRENGLLTGSKCPLLCFQHHQQHSCTCMERKTGDRRIDPGSLVGQKGWTWSTGHRSLSPSFLCVSMRTHSCRYCCPGGIFLRRTAERFVLPKQHLNEKCNTHHVKSKVGNDW